MKTVLVIDMLRDFFMQEPLKQYRDCLTTNINALTQHSRTKQVPIIWVRQEFKEDLSDAYPIMKKENISITIAGTKGCQILPELIRLACLI